MRKKDLKFILISFLTWRLSLFVILYFAIKFVPLQKNFLGGGMSNYISNPYFWSWLNFDGEHYLEIIRHGYQPLNYFFFPGYPLVVRFISGFFTNNLTNVVFFGLVVSNISFLVSLAGLWKLLRLDFTDKITKTTIILLLIFPTSFYFASYYTESLFLATVIWSFYFARKGNWFLSGILGCFSSFTRLIGVVLLPALLTEKVKNKVFPFFVLIVPVGFGIYMYFLWKTIGDPLAFLHSIEIFGPQRSSSMITLPQVFYRYIFKIIPNVSFSYFPNVFVTFLEFGVGIVFLILSILSFLKLRLNYSIFLSLGYLIPTFSGSFSSLPRYVLVLFPAFVLFALWLKDRPLFVRTFVYIISIIGLIISTTMFVRGYWIS